MIQVILRKISIIAISFYLILIVVIIFLLFYISKQTELPFYYLPKNLAESIIHPSLEPEFNFIVLGLDPRNDQLEKTLTTDTVIFGNLNRDFKLKLISIPRDLWFYPLESKINNIYQLALEKPDKFQFIQKHFSELLGEKIDRTLIISTQNLSELVDLLNGIDVELDIGFIDKKYPNPEYITNPSSGVSPYITVEFPPGKTHLNRENIAYFVRSRKSSETFDDGGTDIGRIKRQQLVIQALFEKIKSIKFLENYKLSFKLYNFWNKLQKNITDQDILSVITKNHSKINNLQIYRYTIPISDNPQKGIIYHPLNFVNKQWVFLPHGQDYLTIHTYINNILNEN